MISSNKLKFYCILACATLGLFLTNVEKLDAGENGVEKILSDYREECQAMQAEILPEIDADPNQAPSEAILTIEEGNIYDVKITISGKTATVVFAEFQCSNFGYPWCGSGGCDSFLIVDDNVFEWKNGGRPISMRSEDTVLVARPVSGFVCKDSKGNEGYGASPCHEIAIWDEEHSTFWSQNGSLHEK